MGWACEAVPGIKKPGTVINGTVTHGCGRHHCSTIFHHLVMPACVMHSVVHGDKRNIWVWDALYVPRVATAA